MLSVFCGEFIFQNFLGGTVVAMKNAVRFVTVGLWGGCHYYAQTATVRSRSTLGVVKGKGNFCSHHFPVSLYKVLERDAGTDTKVHVNIGLVNQMKKQQQIIPTSFN